MTGAEYWARRAVADKVRGVSDAQRLIRQMRGIFDDTKGRLRAELETLLKTVATNPAEARRLLTLAEMAGLRSRYGELVGLLGGRMDGFARSLMDVLGKSGRMTRLDAMLAQVDYYSAQLYAKSAKRMGAALADTAKTGYYRKLYDFEQFAGRTLDWSLMDPRRLDAILAANWSGKNWSDRLWGHVKNFDAKLKRAVSRGVLTGASIDDMTLELQKLTGQTRKNAERIVRTESAYIAEQAGREAYREMGVAKYRFLATLDLKTSAACRALDGQAFDVSDAQPGVNYPPMHPNCRSTTVPETEGMETRHDRRTARDLQTGKTTDVPADMTYKQWYEKRVTVRLEDNGGYRRRVTGIGDGVTRKAIDRLYPGLKPKVKNAMMEAHNDVWKFGIETGREKAIMIDRRTGKRLQAVEGTENSVKIDAKNFQIESVILIHNHPSNSSFSPTDIVFLNEIPAVDMIAIQGHNGTAYTLRIGNGIMLSAHDSNDIATVIEKSFQYFEKKFKDLDFIEQRHRIVMEVANLYGWEYRRYSPKD